MGSVFRMAFWNVKLFTIFLVFLLGALLALMGAWKITVPPKAEGSCHLMRSQSYASQGPINGLNSCSSCHIP